MATDPQSSASLGDARTHLRAFGSAFIVVALAFLLAVVFVSLGLPVIEALGVPADSALGRALTSAAQFVGFGVAAVGYLVATDQRDLVKVRAPTTRDVGWILGGILALVGLYLVVTFALQSLGVEGADSNIIAQGQSNPLYYLYLIPVTLLLVGPTEELIFRGVVQGSLREAYGPVFGIIAASAIFAVIHWSSFSGSGRFVTLGIILFLGATLGVLYEKSENILVPATVHGLFNTVQFVFVYASATAAV
jgi:membrane protease YdiL (CAAX protease family)